MEQSVLVKLESYREQLVYLAKEMDVLLVSNGLIKNGINGKSVVLNVLILLK
jgi:hypothetical protein